MLISRRDHIALFSALLLHAGLAIGLWRLGPLAHTASRTVEFEVRRVPPAPPVVTPPPVVEPPRRVVAKLKPQAPPPSRTPPPNATPPKTPPAEPAKPVFGVTAASTVGDSSFSVPVGNTTMIDPKQSAPHQGPVAALPAAPPAPAPPSFNPVSELYVRELPVIDTEACGRQVKYPDEAVRQGIEGQVVLEVGIDEKGRVHSVKVLSGPGHGINEAVAYALKHKCKVTSPAYGTDGKPVAFVIDRYEFNFELNN